MLRAGPLAAFWTGDDNRGIVGFRLGRCIVLTWVVAAFASAFFAGITSILAKLGLGSTDSDVATAVRTCVVLVMAWLMAALVGSAGSVLSISPQSLAFLLASGVATGASWLCYFRALSLGDVSKVTPVDKTSTALSILLAIVLLGEADHLLLKLAACAVILAGTFLMIERHRRAEPDASTGGSWLVYAVLSAVFAALVAILSKVGFADVESNLGTAIRTTVVLVMAWGIVAGKGKMPLVRGINRRELLFIVLSGLATGASWLCYFYAIQAGVVSAVVPIDKLSIVVTVAFSVLFLHEKMSARAWGGLALIVAGTMAMLAAA